MVERRYVDHFYSALIHNVNHKTLSVVLFELSVCLAAITRSVLAMDYWIKFTVIDIVHGLLFWARITAVASMLPCQTQLPLKLLTDDIMRTHIINIHKLYYET